MGSWDYLFDMFPTRVYNPCYIAEKIQFRQNQLVIHRFFNNERPF